MIQVLRLEFYEGPKGYFSGDGHEFAPLHLRLGAAGAVLMPAARRRGRLGITRAKGADRAAEVLQQEPAPDRNQAQEPLPAPGRANLKSRQP